MKKNFWKNVSASISMVSVLMAIIASIFELSYQFSDGKKVVFIMFL